MTAVDVVFEVFAGREPGRVVLGVGAELIICRTNYLQN